jgi:hypothetical protein
MRRETGKYITRQFAGENVNSFVPFPLPPAGPALRVEGILSELHSVAIAAIGRLEIAGRIGFTVMMPFPH